MKRRISLSFILLVSVALLVRHIASTPVRAQINVPTGVIAFVGVEGSTADIYLLDLSSGRIAQLGAPVASTADVKWQPEGDMLVFTTDDGGYGLLRSLRGCFDENSFCSDIIYVVTPFSISMFEWFVGENTLLMQTDDGLKIAPLRSARPVDMSDTSLNCEAGIALTGAPPHLLCASGEPNAPVQIATYSERPSDGFDFEQRYDIGSFQGITAYDIAPDGQSGVGTLETAGDSGFYVAADGTTERFAAYQIHIYDLAFNPDATQIALAGATADSTGDGTLRDGDPGELQLYDTDQQTFTQLAGFTGAHYVAWSPSGEYVFVVSGEQDIAVYAPATDAILPVNAALIPGLRVINPAWHDVESVFTMPVTTPDTLPLASATPISTITPAPTLTPLPLPTSTPILTITPVLTRPPQNRIGTGCEFAYGPAPVAIGDSARVVAQAAPLRLREAPSVLATILEELDAGAQIIVRNGHFCAEGYRWWQVQLLSDGRTGYVADSDSTGYWIEDIAPVATPGPPPEAISFVADRYAIASGECVTIHWAVEGIREVYYQGIGVTGDETRIECPTLTTNYFLTVVRLDGTTVTRTVTINVSSP